MQKSGQLMAQGYIKEVEWQATNMSTAYQSDAYQNSSANKHREMSNYSNNSQYAQFSSKMASH